MIIPEACAGPTSWPALGELHLPCGMRKDMFYVPTSQAGCGQESTFVRAACRKADSCGNRYLLPGTTLQDLIPNYTSHDWASTTLSCLCYLLVLSLLYLGLCFSGDDSCSKNEAAIPPVRGSNSRCSAVRRSYPYKSTLVLPTINRQLCNDSKEQSSAVLYDSLARIILDPLNPGPETSRTYC
jgi:hypothetical protein